MKVIAKRRRLEAGKAGEDVVIKTACYPKDFKLTCEALSSSKRNAVVQMGFGPLMEMGCIKLNRDLWSNGCRQLGCATGEMLYSDSGEIFVHKCHCIRTCDGG
ncbi:PREDICTED: uncharacterized protein LOC101311796 [Fragaria vesca subsp. vesca]